MEEGTAAEAVPLTFPGYEDHVLIVYNDMQVSFFHGSPIIPASTFFLTPCYLVNRRSARSMTQSHNSDYIEHDELLVITIDEDRFNTRDMQRELVIPIDTLNLYIVELTWMSTLPCLSSIQDLTSIELDDVPVQTLPSFGPLLNLTEVTLTELHELVDMPVGIGDAPNLKTVCLNGLINLREFSLEFIRRLISTDPRFTSSKDPHRLKNLYIEKCSAVVPHEINELVGLEDLWLTDCGFKGPDIQEFPDIGRTLVDLKRLKVKGFGQYRFLPVDLSGLRSLERLSIMHVGIVSLPPSISNLQALIELHLQSVDITNIPQELGDLKMLKILSIKNCDVLQDSSVDFCAQCPLLEKLVFTSVHQRLTKMHQRLVEMIPSMRKMIIIEIDGATETDSKSLVDGFMACPPINIKWFVLDGKCYDEWRDRTGNEYPTLPVAFNLITDEDFPVMKALHGGRGPTGVFDNDNNPFKMIDTFGMMMNLWLEQHRKIHTFCWSQHIRLGIESPAAKLDAGTLAMVIDFATGKMDFMRKLGVAH